jgi:ribosome-associated translation inhibitor RaiA
VVEPVDLLPAGQEEYIVLIDVRSHGFAVTDALSNHCAARVEAALKFAAERITSVMVQLSDINGERHGGDDKACHIAIRLRAMRMAVVEAIHRNLYVAIDQAAVKAKAVLSKKLSRWLRVHHRPERGVERWHARLAHR